MLTSTGPVTNPASLDRRLPALENSFSYRFAMQESQTTRWGIVWLAVIAGMAAAAHVGKLPPAMSEMRAELGMSLVIGGWVGSIFSVTGMTVAILAGSIADRIGHWRLVLIGLGALAIGSALGSMAQNEGVLLFSRFIEGFGFISVATSAPSVVARATAPNRRRLALGLWGTYMPAGTALMMIFSPLILNAAGWRVLWMTAAGLSVLWIAVMVVGGRNAPKGAAQTSETSAFANIRLTVTHPAPWILALCFGLYTIPWLALMTWLPSMMIETRGIDTALAAALTALVVALNVPGNLAAGWLLHRGASYWSLIAAASLAMGLSSIGMFVEAFPDLLRYLFCLTFSIFGGMLPAAVIAGSPVFAHSPAQVGTFNGMMVQGANAGQVIGPLALAAVVQATGSWDASVWMMVAACAAGTLAALAFRPIERRRQASR